jgi:hypothetical protein
MARIQVRRYWKRYLTKAKYRYEAYYIYVPKPIAKEFLNIDFSFRKIGSFIVIAPTDFEIDRKALSLNESEQTHVEE